MTLYELLMGAGTMLSNTVRTGKIVSAKETVFTPHYNTTINRDVWYPQGRYQRFKYQNIH